MRRLNFKNTFVFLGIGISIFLIQACQQEAGEGGTSTIRGKVFGKYYNSSFTYSSGSQYVPDKDVYIIYGDSYSFGDRTKTSYDGSYEFSYLQTGKYKVYVYSNDSSMNSPSGSITLIQEVTLTENYQTIELEDFITFE